MFKQMLFGMAAASLLLCQAGNEKLQLNGVFDSNMVLQQQVPLKIFGTAAPDAEVTVSFNGQNVKVKADAKGEWNADLKAMKAGGPFVLKATAKGQTVELKNVMLGEVWFCSGQSNMEMPVAKKYRRGWSAFNCEEEVKNANHPNIRFCKQRLYVSHNKLQKQPVYQIKWSVCSPATLPDFSATAYFFGRDLQKRLNVPVGLIESAWSGSAIQGWISKEGYANANLEKELNLIRSFEKSAADLEKIEENIKSKYRKNLNAWMTEFAEQEKTEKNNSADFAKNEFNDSSWTKKQTMPKFNAVTIRWNRGTFLLPKEVKKFHVFANCGECQAYQIYINGHAVAGWNFDTPRAQKVVNANVNPEFLVPGKNVIAVRCAVISNTWRNALVGYLQLKADGKNIGTSGWKAKDSLVVENKNFKNQPPRNWSIPFRQNGFPANMYNAMVAPWISYPVRGAIWYQGCSNAGQVHYHPLMKALIADWRAKWNNPNMSFNLVQLAGHNHVTGIGNKLAPTWNDGYPLTREIQEDMLEVPNVGVACAIEIGEERNIHPGNKQEVGRRLAAEAMRTAYGSKEVSHGPRFESIKIEGNKVRVSFRKFGLGSGLTTKDGKAPGSFSVAGADNKLYWADSVKIEGNTVVVSSSKVPAPKLVRYAYEQLRGDANLCNKEGFPAYPFRSDKLDYSKVK